MEVTLRRVVSPTTATDITTTPAPNWILPLLLHCRHKKSNPNRAAISNLSSSFKERQRLVMTLARNSALTSFT